MINMSVSRAARICGGRLTSEKNSDVNINRIIIDSRNVEPGDMFVAYKGEKADGHDYIASALEKGAACCLAERVPEQLSGSVILVEDVQKALEAIAAEYRGGLSLPVVGITGSVGKTTAKEMVASVLRRKLRVLKTEGNLNNQIGVPMTLSHIGAEHQAAVVEMGISGFGEMRCLAAMARPTIAVFTLIGHAHLEFLGDLEGVFKAKTEMLEMMPDNGTVIINGDDPWLSRIECSQRLISCGLGNNCDIRAENIQSRPDGTTECDIIYWDGKIHVHIPAHGRHLVYAAMEAAAAGLVLGLGEDEIADGIASYQVVGRRGAVWTGDKLTLVDDCYNANPDSMRSSIDSLTDMPGRHVCILGDMLEMGRDSAAMHYELGRYAVEKGVKLVICCGELGREIARGAGDLGQWYSSREELIHDLPQLIGQGDTVLVKASRGMHLEEISEQLKKL